MFQSEIIEKQGKRRETLQILKWAFPKLNHTVSPKTQNYCQKTLHFLFFFKLYETLKTYELS